MSRCHKCNKRSSRNGCAKKQKSGCCFGCAPKKLLCLRSHEYVDERCDCIKRRTVIACNPCAIPCRSGCCSH